VWKKKKEVDFDLLSTWAPLMGKITKLFRLGLIAMNRQVYSGEAEGVAVLWLFP